MRVPSSRIIGPGLVDSRDSHVSGCARQRSKPGWGINYLVAAIYCDRGGTCSPHNHSVRLSERVRPRWSTFGNKMFENEGREDIRCSLRSFRAFIIWSGQLLKDGLIIFLLVLVMTMVLQLQERISYIAIARPHVISFRDHRAAVLYLLHGRGRGRR